MKIEDHEMLLEVLKLEKLKCLGFFCQVIPMSQCISLKHHQSIKCITSSGLGTCKHCIKASLTCIQCGNFYWNLHQGRQNQSHPKWTQNMARFPHSTLYSLNSSSSETCMLSGTNMSLIFPHSFPHMSVLLEKREKKDMESEVCHWFHFFNWQIKNVQNVKCNDEYKYFKLFN